MTHRLIAAGFVLLLGLPPVWAADPDVLRIGFVDSILQETTASKRKIFGKEFSDLVRDFAGLKCTVTEGINPETSARQLDDEKWHLGVFHGVEFAWVMGKHPKLKPLMIAATRDEPVKALLMVLKDSPVKSLSDLKGKTISRMRLLHCRLFSDKEAGNMMNFFGDVKQTRSVEDALSAVLDGKAEGAVIDTPSLAFYKSIQPGRFKKLRIAAESVAFPPAVIVYHEGTLSDAYLKHLRDSMLKVNQTERGREALENFQVTGFQLVPAGFEQQLKDILQAYPAPAF